MFPDRNTSKKIPGNRFLLFMPIFIIFTKPLTVRFIFDQILTRIIQRPATLSAPFANRFKFFFFGFRVFYVFLRIHSSLEITFLLTNAE